MDDQIAVAKQQQREGCQQCRQQYALELTPIGVKNDLILRQLLRHAIQLRTGNRCIL